MRTRKAGQALVEYVVLLALASVIGVVVVGVAGQQLTDAFDRVTAAVANPMDLLAPPTPHADSLAGTAPTSRFAGSSYRNRAADEPDFPRATGSHVVPGR